jgi:hypothetical protein
MMFKSGAMIAATVATMLTGFSGCGSDDTEQNQQGIKCEGGNLCSGMSECKAAGRNECQGMNKCAGMGYITTKTQAECDAKKAEAQKQAQMVMGGS